MKKLVFIRMLRWVTILIFIPAISWYTVKKTEIFYFENDLNSHFDTMGEVCFCAICVISVVCLMKLSGFRFKHLLSIHVYPTFLLGVLSSSIIFDWHFKTSVIMESYFGVPHIWLGTIISCFSLIAAGLLNHSNSSTNKIKSNLHKSSVKNVKSINNYKAEQIIIWAESEVPIEVDTDDFFNMHQRSERLLGYLKSDNKCTIAIVGDFGSGKTSLTKLTAAKSGLQTDKKLFFVWVSCWGFNDAGAAQEAVLTQIVTKLSEQFDCFAIQGMPSRFVDAVSGTTKYLASFLKYISPIDPNLQLAKLANILKTVDYRLVVVIEDTERKGSQFDVSSIEGLLNRFREISEISFIISASPDAKIDFVRLCEHTEYIPGLESTQIINFLNKVRGLLIDKFPNDIDPIARKPLMEGQAIFDGKYDRWEVQLAKMLNTPRKLKATIRRYFNVWNFLHGEVDIDELLIASCIRVCSPSVFGFLIRRDNEFSQLDKISDKNKQQASTLNNRLREEWANLNSNGVDMVAAGKLVQVLNPDTQPIFDEPQHRLVPLVQEFRSDRNVYRERIFNEQLTPCVVLDQEVLAHIKTAKSTGDWKLISEKIAQSPEYIEVFGLFSKYYHRNTLTDADFWKISSETFAAIRKFYGTKAGSDSIGFTQAINLAITHSNQEDSYYHDCCTLVESCIPKNLQLAVDIFVRLVLGSGNPNAGVIWGDYLKNSLKKCFSNETASIIDESFDEEIPELLNNIIKHKYHADKNVNWAQWNWLGPILLDGMRRNRQKYAPQISYALGLAYSGNGISSDFILNQPILDGVFGSDGEAIVVELAKPFKITKELQGISMVDFSVVNSRAQQWLKQNMESNAKGVGPQAIANLKAILPGKFRSHI